MQQTNTYDCGVHVLVNAFYLMDNHRSIRCNRLDGLLWRLILASLATGQPPDAAQVASLLDTSATSNEIDLCNLSAACLAKRITALLECSRLETAVEVIMNLMIALKTIAAIRVEQTFSSLESAISGIIDCETVQGLRPTSFSHPRDRASPKLVQETIECWKQYGAGLLLTHNQEVVRWWQTARNHAHTLKNMIPRASPQDIVATRTQIMHSKQLLDLADRDSAVESPFADM